VSIGGLRIKTASAQVKRGYVVSAHLAESNLKFGKPISEYPARQVPARHLAGVTR